MAQEDASTERHGTLLQKTQPGLKRLTEKLNLLETSQLKLTGGAWLFYHKRRVLCSHKHLCKLSSLGMEMKTVSGQLGESEKANEGQLLAATEAAVCTEEPWGSLTLCCCLSKPVWSHGAMHPRQHHGDQKAAEDDDLCVPGKAHGDGSCSFDQRGAGVGRVRSNRGDMPMATL